MEEIDSILENIKRDINLSPNNNYEISNNAYGFIISGINFLELNKDDSTIIAYIREKNRININLGNFLFVPYDTNNENINEFLFLKVIKIQYRQEYVVDDATEINAQRFINMNDNYCSTSNMDYKLLVYLEPICILYRKCSSDEYISSHDTTIYNRKFVTKLPKPHSLLFPIIDKSMIKFGLNIPNSGIFIGNLCINGELVETISETKYVSYYLKNDYKINEPLIFRHILICGSTGTGKTFLTKNILRQFMNSKNKYKIRKNSTIEKTPCLIILDPQDEYSQLYEDNDLINEQDKFYFKSENIQYGGFKNTKLFVPNIGKLRYNGLSKTEQIVFTIPFYFVKSNPWILELAELTENQYLGLEILVEDFFNKYNNEKDGTYINFQNFLKNEETRKKYTEIQRNIHESSYDGIVRKVTSKIYESIFDQDAPSIISLIPEIFSSSQISIFPTGFISSSRVKDIIVLIIMTILVDNKLSIDGLDCIKETPIILAIDEAHRYLSNSFNIQSSKIINKFSEAARQGRKECMGLVLITQDPQDINSEIMKQVNTRIILSLHNESALKTLQLPKEYEKKIPFLKRGQAIVYSPDNSNIVEVSGLNICTVKHI